MVELRDLGHPNYIKKTETIQCKTGIKDAKQKVYS